MEAQHRHEVIRRAAQCLADDPTFTLLNGPQQMEEAAGVLSREKGVDPKDHDLVADVLMAVLDAAPTPPPVIPPRAHIPVGKPLEVAPSTLEAFKALGEMGPAATAAMEAEKPVFVAPPSPKPTTFKAKEPRPVNDMPLLRLYKDATGASDSVVAHVTMIPRSTVQAICAGRVHETLDARQRHALRQSLEAQKLKIDAAIAAI